MFVNTILQSAQLELITYFRNLRTAGSSTGSGTGTGSTRIRLGTGNIHLVARPLVLPYEGEQYIEITHDGTSNLPYWGGGNFGRNWILGVSIMVRAHADLMDLYTQASEDVIEISRHCSKVLDHWITDPDDAMMAEEAQQISETGPEILDGNGINIIHIHQQYNILSISPYTELKSGV